MKIGIPTEIREYEHRVAITPEIVKKTVNLGFEVLVQKGAGLKADITDEAYAQAGAKLVTAKEVFACQLVLKVRTPEVKEIKAMKTGTVIIGMLEPFNQTSLKAMLQQGLTAFSLELLPRNTRAQSMDVLSSQANIAGYKAVLLASHYYRHFMPMLMTAAGTVKAARVLILGAGVAGLQAIATAKRMGAVIEASDVRPAVKEQIESLGAKFLDVPYETEEEAKVATGEAGYASAMPQSWMNRQAELVAQRAKESDIIITSALIPGQEPPVLLSAEVVQAMNPGSVIIDLAAGSGKNGSGNCSLTVANEVVIKHGVTIVGYTDLPSLVSADASALYSKNVFEFLKLMVTEDAELDPSKEDELIKACLLSEKGKLSKNTNKETS